jgi:hypothetical protein
MMQRVLHASHGLVVLTEKIFVVATGQLYYNYYYCTAVYHMYVRMYVCHPESMSGRAVF